jgi:hypothetical protein
LIKDPICLVAKEPTGKESIPCPACEVERSLPREVSARDHPWRTQLRALARQRPPRRNVFHAPQANNPHSIDALFPCSKPTAYSSSGDPTLLGARLDPDDRHLHTKAYGDSSRPGGSRFGTLLAHLLPQNWSGWEGFSN